MIKKKVGKPLPDLDKNHPFYSKEAQLKWAKRIKECEREEEETVKENRKRYKNNQRRINGDKTADAKASEDDTS